MRGENSPAWKKRMRTLTLEMCIIALDSRSCGDDVDYALGDGGVLPCSDLDYCGTIDRATAVVHTASALNSACVTDYERAFISLRPPRSSTRMRQQRTRQTSTQARYMPKHLFRVRNWVLCVGELPWRRVKKASSWRCSAKVWAYLEFTS